ncbi:uncharacterized protein TrAFT101_008720 [Trichoderma asperellum]|uniref:uncharacterized protein n=1 Tax=Trichoderma asperellum TaxID=101201 RepID=UPI00332A3986|nr:hypothetical protein TrAFT101_008720 [Trichoderma asperellum]
MAVMLSSNGLSYGRPREAASWTSMPQSYKAINLQYYAEEAHRAGAYLTVDATFGPPPVQNPFDFGADIVLYNGTKYFGGHSAIVSIWTQLQEAGLACGLYALLNSESQGKVLPQQR